MFSGVILFLSSLTSPLSGYEEPSPIKEFPWDTWNNQLISEHLTNMTAELLKDVIYKLNQAEKIQEQYKFSVTYELGTIAAGIQELYKHMIEVYKMYSNLTTFIEGKYDVYKTLNAYHIVQSDYNQIKVESNLFYDILDRHEQQREEYEKKKNKYRERLKAQHDNPPPRPDLDMRGRRRWIGTGTEGYNGERRTVKSVKWSPNSKAFDKFYDVDF